MIISNLRGDMFSFNIDRCICFSSIHACYGAHTLGLNYFMKGISALKSELLIGELFGEGGGGLTYLK